MPNRTTFYLIIGITLLLIALLFRTAAHHDLWKEFFISSLQVVLCAAASLFFLRERP